MIDESQLWAMELRADDARPAVDAVLARHGGGLLADMPYEDPVGLLTVAAKSAQHVPQLIGEVRRLLPAAYLRGPEECLERECDYWYDADGNEIERDPDSWCPHVEVRVATLGDVKRASHLEDMARALVAAARAAITGGGVDDPSMAQAVLDAVADAYERMRTDEDIDGEVVAPDGLVSAEQAGTPRDGEQGHGGDR